MQRLRILFALASPEYLRYYDSTMRLLAERGHDVAVGVNWLRERKHARLEELVGDPRIRVLGAVPKRGDRWTDFARAVRGTFDFVRYLHPQLAHASALRARMKRKSLPPILRGLDAIPSLAPRRLNRVIRALRRLEDAIPVSERLMAFLRQERPDVVIVSPLIDAASDQVDLVRAAQALGIPAVAAIASWDNLTNKGHMRVEPDAVMVWNEHQKTEATTLHGVAPERVFVTGAQLFDRWFERRPSQTREAFCRMVGLADERPFVLYTGSSVFIARSEREVPFVRRWLAALRAADDPVVRDAAVLFRPHPFNPDAWEHADFSEFGPVVVWPKGRYTPASEAARASFFDSLYHSAAVVGINTSAMVEAPILGRPVLTVTGQEFAGTQESTLHFQYLLPENGGFLRVSDSFEVHVRQLAGVLRNPELTREETSRFVGSFIRPHGIDRPCTPILADALEEAARRGPRTPRRAPAARVLTPVVRPLAEAWTLSRRGVDVRRAAHRTRELFSHGSRLGMKRAARRSARLRKLIKQKLGWA